MVLPPVTRDELRLLHDVRVDSQTGYYCVYPRNQGYVGKCFKRNVGPLRTTAREAAEDVVRWWKRHYGSEWYAFFLCRRDRGYLLIQDGKGWRVKAYILGETMPIGGGQIGKVYPSQSDALGAFRRWVRDTFGLFACKSFLFLRKKANRFPRVGHNDNLQPSGKYL